MLQKKHQQKAGPGPLHPIAEARRLGLQTDWRAYLPSRPRSTGVTVLRSYSLAELAEYIDLSPFFQAWELSGPYPRILQDPVVGTEARKLFADANEMLGQIIRERWIYFFGVFALHPASQIAPADTEIY